MHLSLKIGGCFLSLVDTLILIARRVRSLLHHQAANSDFHIYIYISIYIFAINSSQELVATFETRNAPAHRRKPTSKRKRADSSKRESKPQDYSFRYLVGKYTRVLTPKKKKTQKKTGGWCDWGEGV